MNTNNTFDAIVGTAFDTTLGAGMSAQEFTSNSGWFVATMIVSIIVSVILVARLARSR